ncbi:nitroreductase/quinone reductase family protein [Amycolatopsis cynarae]|uniref:Nitroreductase/quinone reductase family protein n=1 Tax=Amycolatopsis cynarae TaxID=2995223 RepID=A0ABY7B932_9PSEU|nr:nitroreductase/quinone reductase family protein [Amycolatopsis sp. HUAS 11-8]WAL67663.1 nitroreductase/quinone reductase family protein [Amycolatopsis sp. HUAS 11-8]
MRFLRPPARQVWAPAALVHEWLVPRALARATRDPVARKHRRVTAFQRRVLNPLTRALPFQTLLETTGRTSGLPRRTPIGGRRTGDEFWFVSEHGDRSQYVRNIRAQPRVRVRIAGRWHTGTAELLRQDDSRARLDKLPKMNSAAVRAVGTDLLTVRVDLDR